jgi:hypothetical protein
VVRKGQFWEIAGINPIACHAGVRDLISRIQLDCGFELASGGVRSLSTTDVVEGDLRYRQE